MREVKKPGNISQEDWDSVDSPPLTDEQLARMRPAKQILPEDVYNALVRRRGQRGPQKEPVKVPVKLRLDPDVLASYKATGRGWQTRINETLREHAPKD